MMLENFGRRRAIVAWQLLFILLSTTWLWAPLLNPGLSSKVSLISQYENPIQPYSWIFRTSDVLASLLLLVMAVRFLKYSGKRVVGWLLLAISVGFFLDPVVATTCHTSGNVCVEYVSVSFIVHAAATVITAAAIFGLSVHDAWARKKLVSVVFALSQVGYGILFVSQLADKAHFNSVSQYFYQTILVVWIAWFCRDNLAAGGFAPTKREQKLVKLSVAAWAFMNGILAIVVSLAHIRLLGRIEGLYFASDGAWLAQHGVVIGVIMLYLSRHLARGEMRARQIFLVITGIETIKYAVISPNGGLMLLYLITFCALFVLRDNFDRGNVVMSWSVRLKDLYFMVVALGVASFTLFLTLDRDSKITTVTRGSIDNFFDYVARSDTVAKSHLSSALLAHTISTFIVVSLGAILWVLFRPYKPSPTDGGDYSKVRQALVDYSDSSEDFFKLWPGDKEYYWQADRRGFIAYRRAGPVVFALANPVSGDQQELLQDFMSWAKTHRLRVCFMLVGKNSLRQYQGCGLEVLQIGASALINIERFLNDTSKDKWWRWQKNRAKKSGYLYEVSVPPHPVAFMRQVKKVSDAWLVKGGHQERGFALGYFNEDYLQQCSIHYIKDAQGNILAFTNQLPEFNHSKTVTVDLLRYLPGSNNAMPYLLYETIGSLAVPGNSREYFDLGFVPFARAKGPLLRIARSLSGSRFSSRGLEQFKNKFNPDWQPNYIAYDGDLADLALIAINLEKAMSVKPMA